MVALTIGNIRLTFKVCPTNDTIQNILSLK